MVLTLFRSLVKTITANRCPSYDKNNAHWKRVDNLIEEQDKVMEKLLNFDKDENNSKSSDGYVVSDFINSSSPVKKACIDLSDVNHDSDVRNAPR